MSVGVFVVVAGKPIALCRSCVHNAVNVRYTAIGGDVAQVRQVLFCRRSVYYFYYLSHFGFDGTECLPVFE